MSQIESDIASLKAWREAYELDRQESKALVQKLFELAANTHTKMEVLLARAQCPSPGLCVQLQRDGEAASQRIRVLEDDRTAAHGGWKTLVVLVAVVSAASGALGWCISYLPVLFGRGAPTATP